MATWSNFHATVWWLYREHPKLIDTVSFGSGCFVALALGRWLGWS